MSLGIVKFDICNCQNCNFVKIVNLSRLSFRIVKIVVRDDKIVIRDYQNYSQGLSKLYLVCDCQNNVLQLSKMSLGIRYSFIY